MLLFLRGIGLTGIIFGLPVFALLVLSDIALPLIVITLFVSAVMTLARYPALSIRLEKQEVRGRDGFIYVFSQVGQIVPVIKVGRETTKGSRIASHKTASPFGVFVWCTIPVKDAVYAERIFHERYSRYRVTRSNEWFYLFSPLMFIELLLLRLTSNA